MLVNGINTAAAKNSRRVVNSPRFAHKIFTQCQMSAAARELSELQASSSSPTTGSTNVAAIKHQISIYVNV
jgi:hypothetical protein